MSLALSSCQEVLRPRRGLGQAGFGFFHQHIRKGKVVITKTSKEKRLLLGSFLAPETDMIFGDGVGASPVCWTWKMKQTLVFELSHHAVKKSWISGHVQ